MDRKNDSVIIVKLRNPPFPDRQVELKTVASPFTRYRLNGAKNKLVACGYDYERAALHGHHPLSQQRQHQPAPRPAGDPGMEYGFESEPGDNSEEEHAQPAGSAAEPATKLSRLLDEILAFLKKYIVFPSDDAAVAAAIWVAHTWSIDAFDFTPYLHISSPVRECGKTRLFQCLKALCLSPWYTISPTEAVLFRKIHAHAPTVLLDEIDTVFSDKADPNKEGIRATLNAGFERGATVPRCHGQSHELKEFSVFCAKAFAGIGKVPETIASRSIKVPMVRRKAGQTIEKLRKRDAVQAAKPIVEALEAWSGEKKVIGRLRAARPEMPAGLGDRTEDICEPLFAIAELAGGGWPVLARCALARLRATGDTDEEETKVQLLTACRETFQTWVPPHITSKDLLKALIEREGEPWAVWWKKDFDAGDTKGPATKLARLLKPFGIIPRSVREADGTTPKGYPRDAFADAFDRYLPPLP